MNSFGERLSNIRKFKGVTQGEVAKRLGIALRTYQSYERGEREPGFVIVQKIARVLNIRMEQLSEPEGSADDGLYEAALKLVHIFESSDVSGPAKDAVLMRILDAYWSTKALKRQRKIQLCRNRLEYIDELFDAPIDEDDDIDEGNVINEDDRTEKEQPDSPENDMVDPDSLL